MTDVLRKLNDDGIEHFSAYLDGLRNGHMMPAPKATLTDDAFSEAVPGEISIEDRKFATRYELGEYLVEALNNLDDAAISHDLGVWSWLGLYYFDQLCPADATGQRRPRMTYTYILSRDFRHHPRHAVRTTYFMVKRYGSKARFMFSKSLSERGEIIEQLAARQELFSCPAVIEAAYRLYDDPERKTFKVGAAGRGQGAVTRLIRVLQQFQLTYDLFSVSGEDLYKLLPDEFERFKSGATG